MFDDFDAYLAGQGRSPVTRHGYLTDLNDYATWVGSSYGEAFTPAAITAQDVHAYLSYLVTVRQVKPATANRRLAALSTFCRWAVSVGRLTADPTADCKGLKQVRPAPKALERADLNRLVRKAQQSGRPLHAAVVTVLAHTGLRVGELCALSLGDVEIGERSGQVTVRAGKGARFREVPLNAEARRALKAYLEVRPEAGEGLFISQRGRRLTTAGAWYIITQYARQAGIQDVSPHVLRHTFGTLLLREGGVDLVTVADLMGHESVDTTMRYTLSNQADRQAAVDGLVR